MKKIILFSLMLNLMLALNTFAHDGHDHGVPGTVAAPKGGEIKAAYESYFELIKAGGNIYKIYVYDGKLKPLKMELLTDVKGVAKIPRGKEEVLTLKTQADHFEANYDPKKSHRFELNLKFKINKKEDSVSYNIEK